MGEAAGAGGPADRVAFFEEQRRNRRATWRLAWASVAAIVLTGIPVSLVITPLVYGVLLSVGELANLVHPLPGAVTAPFASMMTFVHGAFNAPGADAGRAFPSVPALAILGAALLAPGIVVVVALWFGVRSILGRSGVGGLLLALGARAPHGSDLEEAQLQNVVEEMAIAAGVTPPRVMLLDNGAANAAVVGSGEGDATIVMSRRLLDDFSREETQAIAGHLVGSISNGDIGIASTLATVFQTFGLLMTVLDAPVGRRSAESLRRLIRVALRRPAPPGEGDQLGVALAGRLSLNDEDDMAESATDNPGWRVPLIFASQAVKWTLFMFTTAIVGPLLALLWRARRHLADATAVKLTRNPEALWQALAHLIRSGGLVAGGEASSYLFIVGPEAVGWRHDGNQKDAPRADDKMGTNSFVAFHPPTGSRLRRIERQGATSRMADGRSSRPFVGQMGGYVGRAIVGLVFGIGLAAAFAGMALIVGVSVVTDVMVLGLVHELFSVLGAIRHATVG